MKTRARSKHTNNRHLNDRDMLAKGMNPRAWKVKVDNKLRAFGETDLKKGVTLINKKKHRTKNKYRVDGKINPDGTPSLLDTILHEHEHVVHPKEKELNIRKTTMRLEKKLSPKQKKRIYSSVKR